MRFFKRIAGLLGFAKDEGHEIKGEEEDGEAAEEIVYNPANKVETHVHRRGFSVPVQVAVDRASQLGPVLVPCAVGDGGVQGLRWYAKRLRIDGDGDVADEFLDEILPETTSNMEVDQPRPLPKFEVKCSTRQAVVRRQILSHDGKVQQFVEHQGRLQLV